MHTTGINKLRTFYVKSDNVNVTQGSNTNNIIAKLFNSLLHNHYREEQILRNGSCYSFDCVDLLTIQFHDIDLNKGSLYIPSPKWVPDKKVTINPQNYNNNFCFMYSIIAALQHQDIAHHPERINNLKPFIYNYNWKDINFPARKDDWHTFEKKQQRHCS